MPGGRFFRGKIIGGSKLSIAGGFQRGAQWHGGWTVQSRYSEEGPMTRIQWLVLMAIAALLISLCWVEVTRGEGPHPGKTEAIAELTERWDAAGYW